MTIYPKANQEGIPPERVVIEHNGVKWLGLSMWSGPSHPVMQISEKQFLALNLQPNTWYIYYFVGGYWPDGIEQVCFVPFETGPTSTPTPTPEPTPSPTTLGGTQGWMLTQAQNTP